ncbi:MAG: thioesterase domain-containing protein [Pseudomonadota bacterium]|nr:thioesterase domain-containing protein [Pseudomonadota bacterium]
MSIAAFHSELRRRDIQVWTDGGQLRCNAPAGALTPELRDELRTRKAEILEFLRSAHALASQQRALVPLQKDGSRTPIFAVPGHNGDVFCYRALAQSLGNEQPFYGLQPPGVDGQNAPLTRVEDLAAYFAGQIRAFRPKGPVIIAGFCAGGAVAFELGQQLLAADAAVEYVALFGSPHPVFFGYAGQMKRRAARRVEAFKKHVAALASKTSTERVEYLRAKWREREARTQAAQSPVLGYRAAVERATLQAVQHYEPKPFAGRLKLFIPCESWAESNLALRWRRMAHGTEEYYGPEGCTNDNMLRAPNAALFAELFRRRTPALAPATEGKTRRRMAAA